MWLTNTSGRTSRRHSTRGSSRRRTATPHTRISGRARTPPLDRIWCRCADAGQTCSRFIEHRAYHFLRGCIGDLHWLGFAAEQTEQLHYHLRVQSGHLSRGWSWRWLALGFIPARLVYLHELGYDVHRVGGVTRRDVRGSGRRGLEQRCEQGLKRICLAHDMPILSQASCDLEGASMTVAFNHVMTCLKALSLLKSQQFLSLLGYSISK